MERKLSDKQPTVKIYHGYGHTHDLVIYGHVLAGRPVSGNRFSKHALTNMLHVARLFFIRPLPNVRVRMQWREQQIDSMTEKDGLFKFEWSSSTDVAAGWHLVSVSVLDENGQSIAEGTGSIFVPHVTQYAFISDIDDTVLVSHSSTTGKRLRVLFTKNPRSRKTFADVVKFYRLLSLAQTEPAIRNPFFYVSSSEWNLYDDLNEFFTYNELPPGAFLLNQLKRWYELIKTGKTKHQGKLIRIARILAVFPKQRFVLLGDNTQKDPEIYVAIANKYPGKVVAIYLRNIDAKKEAPTLELLSTMQDKSIPTCLFKHTDQAIAHAAAIGLIVPE